MGISKLVVINGLISGFLSILIFILGDVYKYIVGLGIPIVYLIMLILTIFFAYKTLHKGLLQQFFFCLMVFSLSSLILVSFIFVTGRSIGNVSRNIEAYTLLFIIGILVSFLLPLNIKLFGGIISLSSIDDSSSGNGSGSFGSGSSSSQDYDKN